MNRLLASDNPLLQIAGLAAGALVAIGAILLGAVVLSFFIGFALVAGLVIYARVWWLRRKMRKRAPGASSGDEIVEVEYTVVKERTVGPRDGG